MICTCGRLEEENVLIAAYEAIQEGSWQRWLFNKESKKHFNMGDRREAEWDAEEGLTDNGRDVAKKEARMYLLPWDDVAVLEHKSVTDHISSSNNSVSKG